MDILDQTIEQLERKLRKRLHVLNDRESLAIWDDIDHLKKTRQIVANASLVNFINVPVANGHTDAPVTQGDAAIEIIKNAGRPLHVSEILREMPQYGIQTKKQNLVSILLKDRRKRFINKGGNTFDVHPHANGTSQKPKQNLPFSLTSSIVLLLPELRGEFGQPDIYKMLCAKYPESADRIQKASISTTLSNLVQRGLIEVTHKGYGSEPRKYRRREVS
jgi:hypothetical protein